MAFVLVFCVPFALMSIVLTPPILFPDYWSICSTSSLVTLLICSLYNLLVFAVLCQFVIACILSCPVCLVLSCLAKPARCHVFPLWGSFSCCFYLFLLLNKSPSSAPPRVGSFTILFALLEHRARKMSRMEGRGAPIIFAALFTVRWRVLQSAALQFPYQTVMQLVSMLSMVPL